MDNREKIIKAATALIEKNGGNPDKVTIREICKDAEVGIGLINYHFGSKEHLIEVCVESIINGIVENFGEMQESCKELSPFDRLEYFGNITLEYLFDNSALSRISMLTDMQFPKVLDNTHRTFAAYLPLVSACRPDWSDDTVKRKTFTLITTMQQTFLRQEVISQMLGIDLSDKESRRKFHRQMLMDIMEVQNENYGN